MSGRKGQDMGEPPESKRTCESSHFTGAGGPATVPAPSHQATVPGQGLATEDDSVPFRLLHEKGTEPGILAAE